MTARRPGCDLHIRLSEEERRALDDIARKESRTAQGQARHYLRRCIAEEAQSSDALSQGEAITRATRRHVQ